MPRYLTLLSIYSGNISGEGMQSNLVWFDFLKTFLTLSLANHYKSTCMYLSLWEYILMTCWRWITESNSYIINKSMLCFWNIKGSVWFTGAELSPLQFMKRLLLGLCCVTSLALQVSWPENYVLVCVVCILFLDHSVAQLHSSALSVFFVCLS